MGITKLFVYYNSSPLHYGVRIVFNFFSNLSNNGYSLTNLEYLYLFAVKEGCLILNLSFSFLTNETINLILALD